MLFPRNMNEPYVDGLLPAAQATPSARRSSRDLAAARRLIGRALVRLGRAIAAEPIAEATRIS